MRHSLIPERKKAFIAMIICVFLWGFSFISIKIAVSVLPAMTLGALRFAVAIIVLFVFKIADDKSAEKRGETRKFLYVSDIPLLIASSITGVSIYFFFENNGVKMIGAGEASIIVGAIPVLSMISEAIVLKSRIVARQWIGVSISIVGVALVSGVSISLSGKGLGYIYMACSVLLWVFYCFLTRPLFATRSPVYIVFWQSFFGFLGFLPFILFEKPLLANLTPLIAAHIAFLGIFCSAAAYLLYVYALDILGVSVSSLLLNVIPVISVFAAFFLLGERLSGLQWFGSALTIGGVYLASALKRPKKKS
ncbi:MAG: DMT family transporter [Spirochaetaceae bacterium]|jgi:drug/metabolite transporter (DMT)-like permease|nr:DMT family transporter [Spirochaetaceae bacterium]